MAVKRVKITSPKAVYDGLGGKHPPGALVELPVEVADILIARGQAVLPPQSQADHDAAVRMAGNKTLQTGIAGVKERAEAVMRNHDALSPEQRLAAHDTKYNRRPKDDIDAELIAINKQIDATRTKPCDAFSTTTNSPAKSHGTTTPKTGLR